MYSMASPRKIPGFYTFKTLSRIINCHMQPAVIHFGTSFDLVRNSRQSMPISVRNWHNELKSQSKSMRKHRHCLCLCENSE